MSSPSKLFRLNKLNSSGEAISVSPIFFRIFKWLFNPRNTGPDLVRTLFIVNPLLMLPMTVILGGLSENFWLHYLYALIVGQTISLTCYSTNSIITLLGFMVFKRKVRRRTLILAGLAEIGPGLWIGFRIAGNATRLLGNEWQPPTFSDYGVGLSIGSLFFCTIILLDLWSFAKIQAHQLENETLQAKLSALNAQMNPHLLFNALNTIAATIASHPEMAEDTTLKLSELYRGILTSSKRNTHSLATELEICRAYLGIESARFSDRLRWSIDLAPGLETVEIPTLLIQPLVENAIKHGISQLVAGGTVSISISQVDDYVQIGVEDDGIGFGNSRLKNGTGTGVSSCRSRLHLTYGERASFTMGPCIQGHGTRVQIRIPMERKLP